MVGEAVIVHNGVFVTNYAQLNVFVIRVDGKKEAKRNIVLHNAFTLAGKTREGQKTEGIFRMPGGRRFGFTGTIKEKKDNLITIDVEGDYSEDFGKTIKKVEQWQ